MKYIWGRVLRVVFKSSKLGKQVQYSNEDETRSLIIEAVGTKHLSLLRDEFVVDIYNLNYVEIVKLIDGGFDKVEIFAGYKNSSISRIFKGTVFYISNERESRETNIARFICVSNLLGVYRSRVNLSLNSGINMYSAINYIMKQSGIKDSNISQDLKRHFINDVTNTKGSIPTIVTDLLGHDNRFAFQADSSGGATISLWDLKRSDRRHINIEPSKGMVINGYPTLTSDGLRFQSLPVFNYMPGDILLIDNYIIDMSVSSLSEAQRTNLGFQLSEIGELDKGEYLLYKIDYNLSNSSSSFDLTLYAKSKSLLQNMLGGAL